jgi:hypothetical protein
MDDMSLFELFQANSHPAKHVKVATKGLVCGAAKQANL